MASLTVLDVPVEEYLFRVGQRPAVWQELIQRQALFHDCRHLHQEIVQVGPDVQAVVGRIADDGVEDRVRPAKLSITHNLPFLRKVR